MSVILGSFDFFFSCRNEGDTKGMVLREALIWDVDIEQAGVLAILLRIKE